MGKSTLARLYINNYFKVRSYYTHAWWLDAEDETALAKSIDDITQKMGIPTANDYLNPKQKWAKIQQKLAEYPGWLLVFDNAKNPTDVLDYLPQKGGGHILITSRHRKPEEWQEAKIHPYPLKEVSLDLSDAFLEEFRKSLGTFEKSEKKRLLTAIGKRLPFTLSLIGHCIKEAPSFRSDPYKNYLKLYKQKNAAITSQRDPLEKEGVEDLSIAIAFAVTAEKMQEAIKNTNNPETAKEAWRLLRVMAFLHPDELDWTFFHYLRPSLKGTWFKGWSNNRDEVIDAEKARSGKQPLVIILDGFDEIQGSTNLVNHCGLLDWGFSHTKFIITCRTTYLQETNRKWKAEKWFYDGDEKESQPAEQLTIAPYDTNQIDGYIENFAKSTYNSPDYTWGEKDYKKALEDFPQLKAWMTTPFFLVIGLRALPRVHQKVKEEKVPLTRYLLLETFIEEWLQREADKPRAKQNNITPARLRTFCADLACELYKTGKPFIKSEDKTMNPFFSETYTLQSAPLRCCDGGSYQFIHDDFQAFFAFPRVWQHLQLGKMGKIPLHTLAETLKIEQHLLICQRTFGVDWPLEKAPALLSLLGERMFWHLLYLKGSKETLPQPSKNATLILYHIPDTTLLQAMQISALLDAKHPAPVLQRIVKGFLQRDIWQTGQKTADTFADLRAWDTKCREEARKNQ